MKRYIIFCLILISTFCICASAADVISPAIEVIAEQNEMVKTGLIQDGIILFDTYDFDVSLGANVKSITVSALPSEADGRLMLGNLYVVENQVIAREDFSLLKFVSTTQSEATDTTFKFEPNDCGYEIKCMLRSIENVNFSPVASNGEAVSVWTQENISSYGILVGYDPDGDDLKFEIVNYPKKGLLKLTNSDTGDYIYTPYENARGTDAFSYRVRDSYGNYSEICTVDIKVDKLRVSLVFNDLENEKYLNAALIMNEFEIMECVKNEDGTISFKPNEKITKEEFVYLLMTTMGAKNVPTLEKTRFADNDEISTQYRGFIEGAVSLGIINGENKQDGLYFNPKSEITLADAATIINSILGAKANNKQTFKDDESIPSYAKEDIYALVEAGIINGEGGEIKANNPLSRSQTAQILLSLLQFRGKLN